MARIITETYIGRKHGVHNTTVKSDGELSNVLYGIYNMCLSSYIRRHDSCKMITMSILSDINGYYLLYLTTV